MTTLTVTDLLTAARGNYQANLIQGRETWSGSSLRGKAKSYSTKYAASRANLIRRMQAMFPDHTFELDLKLIESRRRRVLVVDGEVW